jgi:hypothetical protein
MRHEGIAIVVLLLVLACGCATPRWTQVGGEYKNEPLNFSVDLPEDWVRQGDKEGLFATREGFLLQRIVVIRHDINQQLPNTKKKFRQDMLPQEAAEVALGQFASDPDYLNLKVVENRPATVGGYPGFRAEFTHQSEDGLRSGDVIYGFLSKDRFYLLRYTAPRRHYFEKDLAIFEQIVRSFKLVKAP